MVICSIIPSTCTFGAQAYPIDLLLSYPVKHRLEDGQHYFEHCIPFKRRRGDQYSMEDKAWAFDENYSDNPQPISVNADQSPN